MSAPKLQRWLDLLAALLARNAPATFLDLARDVPDYLSDGSVETGAPSTTLKRMFERDKLELREFGVPIISVGDEGDEETAYQLRRKDFYLPYLAVMSERGMSTVEKVDRYGYRSLTTLTFEPDELEAIRDGAQRVIQVHDADLTDDVRHALQKLAFDLPLGAIETPSEDAVILPPIARPDPKLLSTLGDALFRRKRVTIQYHGIASDQESARTVEPYGLFFLNGHWYLAACDVAKEGVRNFRVSRITKAQVNAAKGGTPDYDIPGSFVLRDHARSRKAWEIGESESIDATVEFRGDNGAVKAAAALGRPDDTNPSRWHFAIRRLDSFARWLLAFGGDVVPVAPPSLVKEYADLVERTRALYAGRATE
jgi:predicted DNA-binding transcriptional regulator YafY